MFSLAFSTPCLKFRPRCLLSRCLASSDRSSLFKLGHYSSEALISTPTHIRLRLSSIFPSFCASLWVLEHVWVFFSRFLNYARVGCHRWMLRPFSLCSVASCLLLFRLCVLAVPGKGSVCARRRLLVRARTGDSEMIPQKLGEAGKAPTPGGVGEGKQDTTRKMRHGRERKGLEEEEELRHPT